MKRYILLSAVIFLSAMNFGMQEETKSRCIVVKKPLTMTHKSCSLEEIVRQYIKQKPLVNTKLNFKFKRGKPLKKASCVQLGLQKQTYGMIAEDIKSPEEKELTRIVNNLYNRSGRVPTDTEVRTERERENFVNKWNECIDNNPDIMELWKQANDSLLKVSLGYTEELKKQQQAIEKYEKRTS